MTNPRMPAVFVGHGTPLNALAENRYYLPLLYVLGQANGEPLPYPTEGSDGGAISMLSVRAG